VEANDLSESERASNQLLKMLRTLIRWLIRTSTAIVGRMALLVGLAAWLALGIVDGTGNESRGMV
jgi:hypothetical protein